MTAEAEILDRLPFAIFQVDQDERITYCNLAAVELLGPTDAEVTGKFYHELSESFFKAIEPEGVDKIRYYCNLALKNGQSSETVVNGKEGKPIYCWFIPLSDPQTQTRVVVLVLGVLSIRHTISVKQFGRERLEIASRLTHQLNQPLQIILGYISLMLMDLGPDQPHYSFLNKMLEQVEEFNKIIQKLNHLTRD
ncbi:MAG: PAS domain-containing protein [Deltaproteobacteria bacterium]|nr:PAS domain-containing protein [Deltaproteobacteria bacterium]MBW1952484.1 PAS domain-containing protein [Deltaproteobacteria bacterium]MBW1987335.1 PAS domain-containing protein [Deltaproteobacteria bacterium]MBW2135297.1 PAS domain-containing protein [Deltaproteobacteria bacterium]